MRLKKSIYNTSFLLIQQIITSVYGLVVPSLIINTYGSEINGDNASITQFLSNIALLESGIGGVITAALYKPLACYDMDKLSGIVRATEQFFQRLACFFVVYLGVIALVYPCFVRDSFPWIFTFSLVLIMGISTFAQYYFGITYQLLIQADQKSYIISTLQIISTICVLILTVLCVKMNFSIHTLKLTCAAVYVFRPMMLGRFVKMRYKIKQDVLPDREALDQRWDGLAHHVAYIIHYNTDITVLTVFTGVLEVSVYSVYYNIVSNVYKIVSSVTLGIKDSVGNIIACGEKKLLERTLNEFETLNFMLINVFYSCVLILIVPFIKLYTAGVSDVDYIRPYFAFWLVVSEAAYGIRCPYDMIIFAAGHFKQTKKGAYIEACLNIAISLLLVGKWGIEGVAIGTFIAMFFRALQYAVYLEKNIIYRPIKYFLKKLSINLLLGCSICWGSTFIQYRVDTFLQWFLYAAIVFSLILAINIAINYIVYKDDVTGIMNHFVKKQKKIG